MKGILTLLSKKQVIIVSLIGTALCALVLARIDTKVAGPEGTGVLHLQMSYTSELFQLVLLTWGQDGIKLFLNTLWIDFLYPLFYSILLSASGISIYLRKHPEELIDTIPRRLYLLPLLAFVADYSENILHWYIISHRIFSDTLIHTANIASGVKWTALFVTVIGLILQRRSNPSVSL
jgi:hypothetical protein